MRCGAYYPFSPMDNKPFVYRYTFLEVLMNNFKHLKKTLFNTIKMLNDSRALFVENQKTDFTRNRKLPFDAVLKSVICFEGGAMNDELLKFSDYSVNTPTVSAMIQARDKIKVDAFKALFDRFNEKTGKRKLYKGYRLLAIDGCEVPIDNTVYDKETTLIRHGGTNKPYSAFHLNPVYDLLECTFEDLIIQGEAMNDECKAFCELVDRYKGAGAIFIADRGYESYNGFEHVVHSGNKYLIRVKDIESKTSITKSLGPFPGNGEFDVDVCKTLTIRQTNEIKKNPQKYKFCPSNLHFDYMDKMHPFYEFRCRVVRFRISEESYETVITNLDREEFTIEELKNLYNLRWGIETSFRLVKYAVDMNAFHSKKRKLIKQEIYARLLLYNFCQRMVHDINIPKKKKNKYGYQINFTESCHIIRTFLKKKKGGADPPVEYLIAKYILPIRPGRKEPRYSSAKKAVCFNYRYN